MNYTDQELKELQSLKRQRLMTLKDEIKYTVKVYNNARANNVSYITKEHFLKSIHNYKKQYQCLTKGA